MSGLLIESNKKKNLISNNDQLKVAIPVKWDGRKIPCDLTAMFHSQPKIEIPKRDLLSPSAYFYTIGTGQHNIRNIYNIICKLKELCKKYEKSSSIDRKKIENQAQSLIAFCFADSEPEKFRDQFQSLKFPFPQKDGKVGQYSFDQKIGLGGGRHVFGFRPENGGSPLLVFPGLSPSLWADGRGRNALDYFDPVCNGERFDQDSLEEWLRKATCSGKFPAIVVGKDLGGLRAITSAVKFSSLIERATAFNPSTVSRWTYKDYESLSIKPSITTFHSKDHFHWGGGFRVGEHFEINTDRPYQGSFFLNANNCDDIQSIDVKITNSQAKQWSAVLGRGVSSFLKCFPAALIMISLVLKNLLFGCRSWPVCKNGILGALLDICKFTCPFYWVYYLFFRKDHSIISHKSCEKILQFRKNHRPNEMGSLNHAASEAFKNRKLSLKEFSCIYLSKLVRKNRENFIIRKTKPLRLKLITKLLDIALEKDPALKKQKKIFDEKMMSGQSWIDYSFFPAHYLTDLKSYLHQCQLPSESLDRVDKKGNKYIGEIEKFKIFEGKHKEERSQLQRFIEEQSSYVEEQSSHVNKVKLKDSLQERVRFQEQQPIIGSLLELEDGTKLPTDNQNLLKQEEESKQND